MERTEEEETATKSGKLEYGKQMDKTCTPSETLSKTSVGKAKNKAVFY